LPTLFFPDNGEGLVKERKDFCGDGDGGKYSWGMPQNVMYYSHVERYLFLEGNGWHVLISSMTQRKEMKKEEIKAGRV